MKKEGKISLIILLILLTKTIFAGPWFTGPLLAPAGQTIPRGHVNLELYGFITDLSGVYNSFGKVSQTPGDKSNTVNPVFGYGLTDTMDVQYSIPYAFNTNKGAHSNGFSDVAVSLGYQAMLQNKARWKPDLRITLQEILPSGEFKNLDPANNGTDATGLGSYQTALAFNFQHTLPFNEINVLRTRLSLGYVYASKVNIDGLTTYGGAPNTEGIVNPGNMIYLDIAGEFSLNDNWVAVMEAYLSNRHPTKFSGFPGFNANDSLATVGGGVTKQTTLAPAIEYNFNNNIGLIAGPWFTLKGRETAKFLSYVVALNLYW